MSSLGKLKELKDEIMKTSNENEMKWKEVLAKNQEELHRLRR